MIGIIDYDAGNIKSVEKALLFLGQEAVVTRDPRILLEADKVILPGVGASGSLKRERLFWESAWDSSCFLKAVRRVRE